MAKKAHFICDGNDLHDHFEYAHHCLIRSFSNPNVILTEPLQKAEDGCYCWDISHDRRRQCYQATITQGIDR
jgi:hypothetical protein